jgi:hypothetical protein
VGDLTDLALIADLDGDELLYVVDAPPGAGAPGLPRAITADSLRNALAKTGTTITTLATDYVNDDLNPTSTQLLAGSVTVPATGVLTFDVRGALSNVGNAFAPLHLFYKQQAAGAAPLYNTSGAPNTGVSRAALGEVWYDSMANIARRVRVTGLTPGANVDWGVYGYIVGGSQASGLLPGSSSPSKICLNADYSKAFVAGFATGDVSIIQIGGRGYTAIFDGNYRDFIVTDINTGVSPVDCACGPARTGVPTGDYVLVANYGAAAPGSVSVINANTGVLERTVNTPASQPVRVVVLSNTVAFVGTVAGMVYPFNPSTGVFGTGVSYGSQILALGRNPAGTKLYVGVTNVVHRANATTGASTGTTTLTAAFSVVAIRAVTESKIWVGAKTLDGMNYDRIWSLHPDTGTIIDGPWNLPYAAWIAIGLEDFALIPPSVGSPGDATMFAAFQGGYWCQMILSGVHAGLVHGAHQGQLPTSAGPLYTGNVPGVAVDDYGTPYYVLTTANEVLKLPGSRLHCQPLSGLLAEFLDVEVG